MHAGILADVKLGSQGIKKGIAVGRTRLLVQELSAKCFKTSEIGHNYTKAGWSFIRVGRHSFITRWFGK